MASDGFRGMLKLGQVMARRNNLYLFSWICAVFLPGALQLLAGGMEEVRDYLGNYYGVLSLYIFFTMTVGIGASFSAYYLYSCFRRTGSLDLLRVSRLSPAAALAGASSELLRIIFPPVVFASLALAAYTGIATLQGGSGIFSVGDMLGAFLLQSLNILILCAIAAQGFMRNEAPWALLAFLMVLPLNTLPVLLIYVRKVPASTYILAELLVLVILSWLAWQRACSVWQWGSRNA